MARAGLTLRSARAFVALATVTPLVFLAYAAWVYWPGEVESTGQEIVVEQNGEALGPTVEGSVRLRLVPPHPDVSWKVERSDGLVHPILDPQAWDTRGVDNGVYKLVAESDGQEVATRQMFVQNARTDAATAAAVVGTTTVVATGGSALTSSVASRVSVAAIQVGKETALALGEDHLQLRTAGRRRHMPSASALMITLVMVFLFFALEGLDSLAWADYLAALPVAGGVSAVFVAMALGGEAALARAGRAASRIRFLASGAASLVVSSIAFRTPFGFPGYVAEEDDADADGKADQPPHVEAARAAASLLVLMGFLLPFLWIGARWQPGIAEQATEIAVVTFATGALPLKPMPGYDIWRWRRSPAAALALVAYTLYFGFQLAFLQPWWLVAFGWLGLIVYLLTFAWLRGRTAIPASPLYLAIVQAVDGMRGAGGLLTPRAWLHGARRIRAASGHVARWVDAAVAGAALALQRAMAPVARVLAARQQARSEAAVQTARRRFIKDAQAFLHGMETVPDDTEITAGVVRVRLGDIRMDLVRERRAAMSANRRPP